MTKPCPELRQFDGKDGGPIYIALKGVVFDVTSHPRGRAMYGQGGYSVFAGRDASVALAKMEMDPAVFETLSMDDLSSDELDTLEHWVRRVASRRWLAGATACLLALADRVVHGARQYSDTFMKKYTVVGRVVASNKPKEA